MTRFSQLEDSVRLPRPARLDWLLDVHFVSNCDDIFLSLVELEPVAPAENRHVIFFTNSLDRTHQWLAVRGVAVEPTSIDSGGNRLFRFHDLEGNIIEVCVEPGLVATSSTCRSLGQIPIHTEN